MAIPFFGANIFCMAHCSHFHSSSLVIAPVEVRRTSPQITAPATLVASDSVKISLPREVRVQKFFVQEGDLVNANDPVVQLDLASVQSRLTQLRAERRETAADLERNRFLLDNRDALRDQKKMDELQYAGVDKEVNANTAHIDRIDADIAALERDLSANTTLTTPIAGLVAMRAPVLGQTVAANTALVEILTPDPLQAEFFLTADESGSVALGDTVQIRVDEIGGAPIAGSVQFVGPSLAASGASFLVRALFANPDGRLKIGMHAFADFRTKAIHDVFVVPASAVMTRNYRPNVFLVQGNVVHLQPVVVRSIDSDDAVLSGGVGAGDFVVTKGGDDLQDGAVIDVR